MYRLYLALIDSPLLRASSRIELRLRGDAADGEPRPASRRYLCVECQRDTARVPKWVACSGGRKCAPRCRVRVFSATDDAAVAATAAPAAKKPRRAKSDTGQEILLTAARTRPHRITAPKPLPPTSKPRISKPTVDVSSLLDQAHARRMALIAAEQQSATSATDIAVTALNASSVTWQ
jgi:hypothetical protein